MTRLAYSTITRTWDTRVPIELRTPPRCNPKSSRQFYGTLDLSTVSGWCLQKPNAELCYLIYGHLGGDGKSIQTVWGRSIITRTNECRPRNRDHCRCPRPNQSESVPLSCECLGSGWSARAGLMHADVEPRKMPQAYLALLGFAFVQVSFLCNNWCSMLRVTCVFYSYNVAYVYFYDSLAMVWSKREDKCCSSI